MAAPDYHTAEGLFLGGGHGLDTRFQRFRFPGLLKRRDEKGWKEKRVGPQQSKSLSLRWAKYYASFDTGNAVSAHSVWAISTSLPQIHTVTTHHKIHWQHKTFLHEIKYFELGNILQNHKGFIHKTFLSGLTQIIMKKKIFTADVISSPDALNEIPKIERGWWEHDDLYWDIPLFSGGLH